MRTYKNIFITGDVLTICEDGILINEKKIKVMIDETPGNKWGVVAILNKKYGLKSEDMAAIHDYIRYLEHRNKRRAKLRRMQ
jgi:hypothetical protein